MEAIPSNDAPPNLQSVLIPLVLWVLLASMGLGYKASSIGGQASWTLRNPCSVLSH